MGKPVMKKNYLNAKWIATNKKGTSLNQDIESKFIFISSTFLLRISLFKRIINSVQLLSRVRLFATPWSSARQASLSITNSRSSLRLTSIESVMPSSHLILSSPSPLAPNPSKHQSLFQWVNTSNEVAKVLEFQL